MLRSGTVFNEYLMDKMTFEAWKENVDQLVFTKLGLHCNDLPDEDYWLNWDKGVTPQSMANFVFKDVNNMCENVLDIVRKDAISYMETNQ